MTWLWRSSGNGEDVARQRVGPEAVERQLVDGVAAARVDHDVAVLQEGEALFYGRSCPCLDGPNAKTLAAQVVDELGPGIVGDDRIGPRPMRRPRLS